MMTFPTEIDRSAPVLADHGISIGAPLAHVWQIHTDISAWPNWHGDIQEASLEGPLAPGSKFRWTTYGMKITSTIYAVEDRARLLWGGGSGEIVGIHDWIFTETPSGVLVRTLESFAGSTVASDPSRMKAMLDQSLVSWLERLKGAAESGPR